MKSILYKAVIPVLLLLLSACRKEQEAVAPVGGQIAALTLQAPLIADGPQTEEQSEQSRGALSGTLFYMDYRGTVPADGSYKLGIFMMKTADPSQVHASGEDNMLACLMRPAGTSYFTEWHIFLNDGKDAAATIPLYKDRGNVDFCSYYPYDPAITDPTHIPFDATLMTGNQSTLNDYLWSAFTNLNPLTAADMTKTPVFRHAMSLMNFTMQVVSGNDGMFYLNKINIETEDGAEWIPIRGTFDATTGAVTATEFTSSLDFYYNWYFYRQSTGSYGSYQVASIILPPVPVASTSVTDRRLKVTVYFNKDEIAPLESGSILVDLAQWKNGSAGTLYGLQAGYVYSMTLNFDPSVRFINFDYPDVLPWGQTTITVKI